MTGLYLRKLLGLCNEIISNYDEVLSLFSLVEQSVLATNDNFFVMSVVSGDQNAETTFQSSLAYKKLPKIFQPNSYELIDLKTIWNQSAYP